MGALEGAPPGALVSRVVRLRYEATAEARRAAYAALFQCPGGARGASALEHVQVGFGQPVVLDKWAMTEVPVTLAWSLVPPPWAPKPDAHAAPPPTEQRVGLSLLRPLLWPAEVRAVVAALPRDFDLDRADVEMVPKRWIVVERAGEPVEGREKLAAAMRPLLEQRVLPFVRRKLSCPGCLACSSIVRRYSHALGERHRDPPHTDGQAFATVVVALNTAGEDYDGGLYVITDPSRALTLALRAGDAVVHRWDLQHGVQVDRGSRLSWILWVQDSPPCVAQEELHQRRYFREAAEAGNVVAMHILGSGASGRSDEGKRWLTRAAEAGFVKSMAQLGTALQGVRDGAARRWLELASERGDASAQAQLGMLLLRAGEHQGAEAWLRRAAAAGHATAQNELGMVLLTGAVGRPPEPEAAVEWLQAAARQGHAMAQTNLGVCFAEGRGTKPSLPAALYWWNEAAIQELPDASENLARLRAAHPDWQSWPPYAGS